jgi:hypothetical protein
MAGSAKWQHTSLERPQITICRKLKPFASETRLDDLALTQDMATREICHDNRKAFFDHAVTSSFRRTVVVSHSGLVRLAPQDAPWEIDISRPTPGYILAMDSRSFAHGTSEAQN